MNDYPKHYCGIFGVKGAPNAAEIVYKGLFALQHRGQESSGIASADGGFHCHKAMGLVASVFNKEILQTLPGNMAIGHNRYATTGGSGLHNAQPLLIDCKRGPIAIAHNGNLTNTARLRKELEDNGAIFQTTTDSEVMLHLLARSDKPLEEAILDMMDIVEGAYSLVIMTPGKLIAVRDPYGFRPLSIGNLDGVWVVTSETCALDLVKIPFERDVKPGEIIIFDEDGMKTIDSRRYYPKEEQRRCIFEWIYFARPDSIMDSRLVYETRVKMGKILAEEFKIEGDIVVPILDGGTYAALGYSRKSGIMYEPAFVRNHYVGRTFINPTQQGREDAVDFKLNLIPSLVKGKRVIVIDDSIVRCTTSLARVKMIREAGASEVHMLISCPPHRHHCGYGIDFPDSKKLIARTRTHEEIRNVLGLDSLGYLSEAGLLQALGDVGYCLACFNGKRLK